MFLVGVIAIAIDVYNLTNDTWKWDNWFFPLHIYCAISGGINVQTATE